MFPERNRHRHTPAPETPPYANNTWREGKRTTQFDSSALPLRRIQYIKKTGTDSRETHTHGIQGRTAVMREHAFRVSSCAAGVRQGDRVVLMLGSGEYKVRVTRPGRLEEAAVRTRNSCLCI